MLSRRARTRILIAVLSAVATALIVLFALNLDIGGKQIDYRLEHLYGVEDPQFLRSMGVLLGPPIAAGNRVEALLNGDEIFPSMLEAIRGAKNTITFETYIYWSGSIGRAFTEALVERSQAGVRVHLLIDWVGSGKMEEAYLEQMRAAGVRIEKYHPLEWYTVERLNNRTHRRLLVVDGRIGFTGGAGIADIWLGDAQDPSHWRDTHFRIRGPAVAQMQAAFVENWVEVTGEALHGSEYFAPIADGGEQLAQVFKSSPTSGSESMHLMYLLSITAARQSILLSNAYFVPDAIAVRAMIAALRRGVQIRVITPGSHTDVEVVRSASRALWGDLMRAGAEFYEYQPTMFHCKVMIVDGHWVSVGSTNFDSRSFSLNDEANLNVYDAGFARRQVEIFEDDLKASRRVSLEEWENRPWGEKLLDNLAILFRAQL